MRHRCSGVYSSGLLCASRITFGHKRLQFFSPSTWDCVIVMKINIISSQKTAQQLPCFAYNHISTQGAAKSWTISYILKQLGRREGKRASERGRIVCLPLIRADEQLSSGLERERERERKAPPYHANKMSRKRWEKKEEHADTAPLT
jgi:hypothetical protein